MKIIPTWFLYNLMARSFFKQCSLTRFSFHFLRHRYKFAILKKVFDLTAMEGKSGSRTIIKLKRALDS